MADLWQTASVFRQLEARLFLTDPRGQIFSHANADAVEALSSVTLRQVDSSHWVSQLSQSQFLQLESSRKSFVWQRGGVQKQFSSVKPIHKSYPSLHDARNSREMCCWCVATHLLWHTESTHHRSHFLSLSRFCSQRFSFMVSCWPSSVNCALVGAVFILPVSALAWPYRKGNHHNKALWIIRLGHLILSGSKLLSPPLLAFAKSQRTVRNSAKKRLTLMQILLFEGKRPGVSWSRRRTRGQVQNRRRAVKLAASLETSAVVCYRSPGALSARFCRYVPRGLEQTPG